MKAIHGGDVYTNQIEYDFSVNINPLGVPEEVKAALHDAVNDCSNYPDINQNNPTGKLIDRKLLLKLLRHCQEKNIDVVLDECFIEFCGKELSMINEIDIFTNLIIIRAFTKIYSRAKTEVYFIKQCLMGILR